MGATKNRQSFETLTAITEKAIPGASLLSAVELTEGLCNAAYLMTLSDGREIIIKIAPKDKHTLMTNETGMMDAEVAAMRLARENTDVPVAKVYAYDTSLTLCDSPYLLMERLRGKSYFACKKDLTKEQIDRIDFSIGEMIQKIAGITGDKFGSMGDPTRQTSDLHSAMTMRITDVLSDGAKRSVPIGHPNEEILEALSKDGVAFAEVVTPRLTHFDLWDGNIFITDGRVTGIIDWERACYAEPLMEDRFRRHSINESTLRGAGIAALTPNEKRRCLWYDVFLFLTMMVEGAYREYEDDGQYRWVQPLFEQSYQEILLGQHQK